jgi:glycosyltransferase involved in cell wall biosynthesis
MGFWYSYKTLIALRLANLRVDGIVCNCQAVAARVRESEKIPLRKLITIYNGFDGSDISDYHSTQSRTKLIEDEYVNVALVANVRRIKRVQDLIYAAGRLEPKAPRLRFWVIGAFPDASYRRELERLVDELALRHRIRFVGPLTQPTDFISQCDIGVLTSESEGLSNTIIEYMSVGLPVICSDVGGNPELIEDSVNGFLYSCGDTVTFADKLLALYGDPAQRRRMGETSRARIANLTVKRLLDEHERLYRGSPDSRNP